MYGEHKKSMIVSFVNMEITQYNKHSGFYGNFQIHKENALIRSIRIIALGFVLFNTDAD